MTRPTFDRMIAPLDRSRLTAEVFEKAPRIFEEPRDFDLGLDFSSLDQLMWVVFGSDRDLIELISANGSGSRPWVQNLRLDHLYGAFGQGQGLRFTEVETVWAPVAQLVADTAKALSAEVTAEVVALPPGFTASSVSWAEHDGFLLQLDGSGRWGLYRPWFPLPSDTGRFRLALHPEASRTIDENDAEELVTWEATAGQCLYVPRGTYRRRGKTDGASVYLELAVRPLTRTDLAKTAIDAKSLGDPSLRASLPPGFVGDAGIRVSVVGEWQESAGELGDEHTERALTAMYKVLNWRRPMVPDGHFAELAELEALDLDTELERRVGLDVVVAEPAGGKSLLVFAGTRVDGPAKIQKAMEFIAGRDRFKIREIPLPESMDEASKVVLARKLLVKGLVRRAGADDS